MKKILVCMAAALAIGAVACGKSAAVSLCEKMNTCMGTTIDCNAATKNSSGTTKCTAEADSYTSCLDSKGTCKDKVYSAGDSCNTELANYTKCATTP